MDDKELRELRDYKGDDRVVSSVEYLSLMKNENPPRKYLTGIAGLDKLMGGFEDEELTVISGPTNMGKTTLCRTIMRKLANEGKRPLFFSFEIDPKHAATHHNLPANAIYLPLTHKATNLRWLAQRCAEAAVKYADLSAVFIDHLHYIIDMSSRNNMSLEIGTTMRFLKWQIAVPLNVPVFIVCHMVKIPMNEEPNINHLRDSALIACESDTVIVLWRRYDCLEPGGPPQKTMMMNLATIKVEKSRRLGTLGQFIHARKTGDILEESEL
jgi:replicative DNA helicase